MRSVSLSGLGTSLSVVALLAACGGQVEEVVPPAPATPGVPATAQPEPPPAPGPSRGPSQLAEDVGVPSAISLTGNTVVFTTSATRIGGELVAAGALFVADKRTGPALMIHVDRQGASFDTLATVDDTAIVTTSDGRVLEAKLAGGSVTELAELPAPAVAVAASAAHVFAASESGALSRVDRATGAVESLGTASGPVRALALGDGELFAAVAEEGTGRRGALVRVDLASRAAARIAEDLPAPCAMARGEGRLFWTSAEGVLALGTQGGAPAKVSEGSVAACAIATDGANLFFATTPAGDVTTRAGQPGLGLMRAPTSGGAATPVVGAAAALAQPGAVATDATDLYWLTSSGVLRLRK